MKKLSKLAFVAAVAVSLSVLTVSCGGGGGDPKALAKEAVDMLATIDAEHQRIKNMSAADKKKAMAKWEKEWGRQGNILEKKLFSLSEADKKIFSEEGERLAKEKEIAHAWRGWKKIHDA